MTSSKVTQLKANDYGQYLSLDGVEGYSTHSYQGYQEGHFIQGQVYGPPRSDYYQHYQVDGPPMPSHVYTIGQGSGTGNSIGSTSIGISGSSNGISDVPAMPTVASGWDYPYVPHQGLPPGTSSSLASSTVVMRDGSHLDQVWFPSLNYNRGQDGFPSSGGATFGSSNLVPWPASPLLDPLAAKHATSFDHGFSEQHTGKFSHQLNLADPQNTIHTVTPPSFPHINSLSPPSPYHDAQSTPLVRIGSDGRTYSSVYHLPQNNFTNPSRRRNRPARAIEHNGLLMDEEELLEGLTAPGAKITVLLEGKMDL
ncbi:hypothetical protein PAXINDRAFT_18098 [Paxillus involutus ATCC 200175]|uniref:Uncharacterized protein n=1 Tax=Paxillus involutus ATCC 200175 TaxID=664439 RepID=A0A0C9TNH7_PAXIN|nr:hypothetical protein PAXINDRAFT_18098 [Paxillus involutus ATCC 200175]